MVHWGCWGKRWLGWKWWWNYWDHAPQQQQQRNKNSHSAAELHMQSKKVRFWKSRLNHQLVNKTPWKTGLMNKDQGNKLFLKGTITQLHKHKFAIAEERHIL